MQIDVSIIVPVLNDEKRLALCLDAIRAQETQYKYEVIVVDNGSRQLPSALIEKYSFARLAVEHSKGSYRARNRGLRYASGRVIAFTDSDCIPRRDWIERAMSAWDDRNADLLGGKIVLFCKDISNPTLAELYEFFFAFNQMQNIEKGFAVTANLFVASQVFEKIGTFYQGTKSGGDVEFAGRAIRNGFKLAYDDSAVVFHPARRRIKELTNKKRRLIDGFFSLRQIEPVMAKQFAAMTMFKHLLPPVLTSKTLFADNLPMDISNGDRLRLLLLVYHQKLFSFWYKLAMVIKMQSR